MKEKDLLDDKIWVVSQIEESMQEVEELIGRKIKELEYEETVKKIHSSIDKLNKDIEQVDYNKSRALESLEQDISLKLDDVRVVEDNILEQKIKDISENNIIELKKVIDSLEKNLNKNVTKSFKELKTEQENKFIDFKDNVELQLEKAGIEEQVKEKIERDNQLKSTIKEIEDNVDVKLEELKNEVKYLDKNNLKQETELLKVKEEIQKQKDDVDITIQNLNDEFNKANQEKNDDINYLEELLIRKLEELKEKSVEDLEGQKKELIELITDSIDKLEIDKIRKNDESIFQKVSELETINQNKLDKIRKSQEKFIIEKVSELDSKQELDKINSEMQKMVKTLEDTTQLIQETKRENLKEVKNYVESRILRMKYAMTIEALKEEIGTLKLKIRKLEQRTNNRYYSN